jgi:hypothetical protein
MRLARWAPLALLLGSISCFSRAAGELATPPEYRPANQAKCTIAQSHKRPLVIEWPAADRAALDAQSKKGLVVVRYSGCTMELLPGCRAPGAYGYFPTTRKLQTETIKTEEDLYAKLPVGAVGLEGKLHSAGSLDVEMSVVGTYESSHPGAGRADLQGDCTGATHVLTSLTVGAFEFYAGGAASVGAALNAPGVGVSGSGAAKRERLAQDGVGESCAQGNPQDTQPPPGCGALLRVETVPIVDGSFNAIVHPCPPGSSWDGSQCVRVTLGQEIACPAGMVWTGSNCAPTVVTSCPTGTHFEGGRGCVPDVMPTPAGRPMIRIPGGAFLFGEGPKARKVTVTSFEMDVTEVTNADYQLCVDAGKCPPPVAYPPGKYAPRDYPNYCNWETNDGATITARLDRLEHPVNCIDRERARYYCEYVKKRLPSEEEWELAARGTDGRVFPWGAADPTGHACFNAQSTCKVGAYPNGKSPYGLLDMAGNVWEWTSSSQCGKHACPGVLRGGAWGKASTAELRATSRLVFTETSTLSSFGVRCAR